MNSGRRVSQEFCTSATGVPERDVDAKRQVLRERAIVLAREIAPSNGNGEIEIIEFMLAHEKYGIEAVFVREVFPLKDYTVIPGTPAFVLGVINVRSQIVSVIDIRQILSLPRTGITDLNKVIIIHDQQMEFGLLADRILGARFVRSGSISDRLNALNDDLAQYLKGITHDGTILLDGSKLLNDPALVVQEQAERQI